MCGPVAVADGLLLEDLSQALLGLCVLINAVKAGNGHLSAGRSGRSVSFNRHSLILPLCHVLEQLNVLGVFAELYDGFLPRGGLAHGVRAGALCLAVYVEGVYLDDGDVEDLFDGLLYLDLGCILSDFKSVLFDVQVSMDCSVMMGRMMIS